MNRLVLIAGLVLAASPAAAQVVTANGQTQLSGKTQLGGQSAQPAPTQAPVTGTFCIEEMTATFCNTVTGPNTNGYGTRSVSGSSSGSASGGLSASGGGGSGANTSSFPPCPSEPPFNELCD
jgi:hypothetical protein